MVMPSASPVALVTGGARRIGRAIVEDLAAHGWAVAIHCNRSRDEAERLAAAIRGNGGRAAVVTGDFADPATPAAHHRRRRGGARARSTLLVNNASIFERDAVGALDRALWDRQMAINLTAPVFLAEAFAGAGCRKASRATSSTCSTRASGGRRPPTSPTRSPSRRLPPRPSAGAGAGAARPRQRHRARPGAAQRPPDRRGLSPAGRRHAARPRAGTDRIRPHHPLYCRDALDHRPGDRASTAASTSA